MKLVLEKDQKVFFTSDTHYHHANICSATTKWSKSSLFNVREFDSLEHMNTTLVNNINEVVGENDILIHLGDWSFGGFEQIEEFRSRLACKNIHLVLGNHDHHIENNKGDVQNLFKSVHNYVNLNLRRPSRHSNGQMDKYNFILCHFPIASWDRMKDGVIHLHGHVHLSPQYRIAQGKAMDVGCEGSGLMPIELDEIFRLMKNQPVKSLSLPMDHHEII
jgi:calcineurin-like phosphoesterase family protein